MTAEDRKALAEALRLEAAVASGVAESRDLPIAVRVRRVHTASTLRDVARRIESGELP